MLKVRRLCAAGKAFRVETAAEEAVLILRAAEVGGEVFTLTSSMCWSASQYIETSSNNAQTKDTARKVARVFFFLTMLGAGATIYARKQATRAAREVLTDVNYNSLPQKVKDVVIHLTGVEDAAIATFRSTINNLDANTKNLYNGFVALSEDLQKIFLKEFEKATQVQLKLMNDFPNTVNNWKSLYLKAIKDRSIIHVIVKQSKVDAIVKYYTQATNTEIRSTLEAWDFEIRWKFLDKVGIDDTVFNKLKNNNELVNAWGKYYLDGNTRIKFMVGVASKQMEFLEDFQQINSYWYNRIRRDSKLFDRYYNANSNSKLLAKQNPKLWIRINRYYPSPTGLGEKLTSSYLKSKYGNYGEILVNKVETKAQELLKLPRKQRDLNHELVCGVIDKETGLMSELFTNFPKKQFKLESQYIAYRDTLHPNIKNLIIELENVKSLYNVENSLNLDKAGHYIGAHAEVRALDDLIKKRFGNELIDETVFNEWLEHSILGYNRNVVVKPNNTKIIMPRCCDCFYITDLLTFIQ